MIQNVHAIVVHYLNGPEFQDCIESLIIDENITSITVIDNSHLISEKDLNVPESSLIQVVKPSSNLGYAAGNNVGIKSAIKTQEDLVLVINPDASLEPGGIKKLVAEMLESDFALISPSLIEPTSTLALSSPAWDMALGRNITDTSAFTRPISNRFKPIFFGACFLGRADMFTKIGLLNDQLFLYGEELDLVFRMEQHGYKWGISSTAFATHLRGTSTGQYLTANKSSLTEFHSARSMVINARNYAPRRLPIWLACRLGYALLKPKLDFTSRFSVIRGLLSGLVPKNTH